MAPSRDAFEVFLSHEGGAKLNFVADLWKDLESDGVQNVFLDYRSIPPCAYSSLYIRMAASKARVGIFVLTPHYVTRPWPMEELRIFLDRQADAEKPFLLVLYYGLQPEEIGNPKMLLRNHPEVAEHWAYQELRACISGLTPRVRYEIFRHGENSLCDRAQQLINEVTSELEDTRSDMIERQWWAVYAKCRDELEKGIFDIHPVHVNLWWKNLQTLSKYSGLKYHRDNEEEFAYRKRITRSVKLLMLDKNINPSKPDDVKLLEVNGGHAAEATTAGTGQKSSKSLSESSGTAWGAVGGLGDRPDRVHVTMPHPGTSIKEQGRKELGEVGRLAGQQAPVGNVSDEFVSTGFGVAPSSSELGCKRAAEEVPEVQLSKSSGASDVGGARTRVTSSRGPRAGQEGAERGRGEQGHRKPVIQARGGVGESSHDSMRLGGQQLETGAIGPEQELKEAKLGERQTDERTRPGQALEKKRGEDDQLLAQVEPMRYEDPIGLTSVREHETGAGSGVQSNADNVVVTQACSTTERSGQQSCTCGGGIRIMWPFRSCRDRRERNRSRQAQTPNRISDEWVPSRAERTMLEESIL